MPRASLSILKILEKGDVMETFVPLSFITEHVLTPYTSLGTQFFLPSSASAVSIVGHV